MRYSFEAHLIKFGPVNAVWCLPDALTGSLLLLQVLAERQSFNDRAISRTS